jgi:hypothetical protein
MPAVRPRDAVAVLVLICAGAFYMWTAATSIAFDFGPVNQDVYNLMATGFLHGHTYLPVPVPSGLAHLANPYDPAQNASYQAGYHDLSLYHGRFYSSWGPSPALLFMLFRITPFPLSASFAVALYAFVGLSCAVALMRLLFARLIPEAPGWLFVIAVIGLALSNTVPFLLRRPAQYEVAIAGGYCFVMAGLLLIVAATAARPARWWRLALGSLLLGLAIAARPSLVVAGVVPVAAAACLIKRRGAPYRVLVPALLPVVLCGLALAAYDQVRFHSPTEFGQHYQLATIDVEHKAVDKLGYVPPGVFSYLLIPPRVSLTFPNFFLQTSNEYPGPLPAGYSGTPGVPIEPAGGVLPTMPITVLLVALAVPPLWRRKRSRAPVAAAAALTVLALGIIVILSYGLWGTTQRYEVDFATYLLIAAYLVWAVLWARSSRRWLRWTIGVLGAVLTAVGVAVGVGTSFQGYANLLELEHPGTYRTLEDLSSPAPTLATVLVGHPVLTEVDGPVVALPALDYNNFGEAGASAWLGTAGPVTVTVIAPGSRHLSLKATAVPAPGAPSLTSAAVTVTSPGQREVSVPLSSAAVRLPLAVHLGLNRIRLNLTAPRRTLPQDVLLSGLVLGS